VQVVDGIWLGSTAQLPDAAELEKEGIVATLAVGEGVKAIDTGKFMHSAAAFGDEESASILPCFPKAFKQIAAGVEDGGVFIYCASRQGSCALATGFLMATLGLSFEDAWAKVREATGGQVDELNRNLKRQLTTWAKWPEFPGLPEWM